MVTIRDEQRDRLRRTIDWAREIERHLAHVRERRLGEVHFRPASTGISMIGLRPDRPQRGKSGITDLRHLAGELDSLFREYCVDCDQGRLTPEKRLQSHLIAEAYRNERRLESFRGDDVEPPVELVTDELSLPREGGNIVCDLLALHGTRPAVIELKPRRELRRLVEQVTAYARLVEEHLDLFEELCSVLLGRHVELVGACERWIVWPAAKGHDRDPREEQLASLGIRVVAYSESEHGFELQTGRRVQ